MNDKNKVLLNLNKYLLDLLVVSLGLLSIYLFIVIFDYLDLMKIIRIIIDALIPVFIGLLIAYLLEPIFRYFDKLKVKRKYSVTIIYLIITIAIFLITYFLVPNIFSQIEMFYQLIPEIMDKINSFLGDFKIDIILSTAIERIGLPIMEVLTKIIGSLAKFGIGLGTAFFVSLDFKLVKKVIMKMPPNKYRSIIKRIINQSGIIIFKYAKGMLLDTSILFVLAAVTFYFVGFDYFYVYALIIAITNLIPFIGAWIGGIPIVIVALFTSYQLAIIVVIIMMVLQYIESTFIQPLILKEVIKLHPIVEVMALIFFGGLFGVIGMIASPVLTVIIKYIYNELTDGYIPND